MLWTDDDFQDCDIPLQMTSQATTISESGRVLFVILSSTSSKLLQQTKRHRTRGGVSITMQMTVWPAIVCETMA